ncbi:M23 family metallopeptidase [Ornithinimicrobium panacihumi]|uniref:M23 family metallopeptidase n=1 Tax=Ornithinimicrobium panacihumi TaxID=2008449 RepID=UPI003F893193
MTPTQSASGRPGIGRTARTILLVLALLLPGRPGDDRSTRPDEGAAMSMGLSAVVGLGRGDAVSSSSPPVGRTRTAAGRDREATALWDWPLVGTPRIVNGYEPPVKRWLPGHRGIDLAGVAGEPVLAVDAGVVAWSGTIAGVGMISVDHESGLRSTYQPVSARAARGDRVGRGQQIAVLDGGGHCGLVDCLHLGARRGKDTYVDPTPLLIPLELTLVPLGG